LCFFSAFIAKELFVQAEINDKVEEVARVDISTFSKDYERRDEILERGSSSRTNKNKKRESGFFDSLADKWWIFLIVLLYR